ncbi:MAG: ribonuclease H-like domain-containing protein [Flavobacteriales bacterium]|nr:ribonuclease H-like domain-containing protein [Flavobacteriales bacterium]MCB9449554.1 ribonuclease H-like domain-containing protein [Flavobacteriales bacterium]
MLDHIHLSNVLFLDIETVPAWYNYGDMPEAFRELWDKKATSLIRDADLTPEDVYERAGIYAEFGKIICISVGYVKDEDGDASIRIKSFSGEDEKVMLAEFARMLDQHYGKSQHVLCAHNGKEFDFPYMARRMLVNGLRLPKILDIAGKKPWEVNFLDTMELWKFGDFKNYTSLNMLTTLFGIPTPKDDITGADVARVFWEDHDLARIVTYCQKDVVAIIQLMRRFKGQALIDPARVQFTDGE